MYNIFQLVSIELFISIGIHENLNWYQNIKYFLSLLSKFQLVKCFSIACISIGKMFQLQLEFKIYVQNLYCLVTIRFLKKIF